MGIAVEPVEPCYDSDCYYARGETLTWWQDYGYTPPSTPPIAYEPPRIEPPPRLIDYSPSTANSSPKPPFSIIDIIRGASPTSPSPSPPPSGGQTGGEGGQTGGGDSSTSPLPVPETGDPLYRVIGDLLSSRPAPAQATPVVVQGKPTNPWPIALVGLTAVGAVAYVMVRRGK
jgi:hypothetical protein